MKLFSFLLIVFTAFSLFAEEQSIPTVPEKAGYICIEGDEWARIRFNATTVEKGSILDFSSIMNFHKPAGKYGFIKSVNGHFEFEGLPGIPQRFFGVNLSTTVNVLGGYAKEDAALLAETIARAGYNSVRFHHYDDLIVSKANGNSTDLDPEQMDRFDYLVSECKKRGIYMTIDLYVSRYVIPDEIPDFKHQQAPWNYKNAVYLLESVQNNFLTFCRNFLSHRNPYTGLTYAEEPAFAFVSILNENGMRYWRKDNYGGLGPKWEALFNAWCDENEIATDMRDNAQLRMRFIQQFQNQFFSWMRKQLQNMGLKTVLTDENNISSSLACLTTENYDYVDTHYYFGFPKFLEAGRWGPPALYDHRSWIEHLVEGRPFKIAPVRKLDRPFTITEMRWMKPMAARAECGLIMGAIAAFQDYSGIETFQWSWGGKDYLSEHASAIFDLYGDPISYTSEHILQLLFLRGDVSPADATITMVMPNDASQLPADNYSDTFALPAENTLFAFVAKYGNSYVPGKDNDLNYWYTSQPSLKKLQKKLSNGPVGKKGLYDAESMHFISCTGEIEINCQEKIFKVATPKSEGLVQVNPGKQTADALSIDSKTPYTTCFASSLDEKALADSNRIIFFHLTNTVHDGMKFNDRSMKIMMDYGGYGNPAPHLVLRSEADVALKLNDNGKEPAVYAINMKGERVGKVESTFEDGTLRFTANTSGLDGQAVIVYEIAR